jgi:phenylpropionate dioxygenase-like ring-hydroxylating dioxygenase large terminal subunit
MTTALADDQSVIERIFEHIDRKTTDLADEGWREPVENYRSEARFAAEVTRVLRRHPTPFCPSAALADTGTWVAREAAGVPLLAVRGKDGVVRVFRNACRHRGTRLVDGAGCNKVFECRYHGWTYDLDGGLRHVPHEYGFPGLDKRTRGLVPVETIETRGLVFVTQEQPGAALDDLPPLLSPEHRLLHTGDIEVPANWKVVVESFLEGYHIRSTHPTTFYPVQYDNLNVVERFGRNNRVAFPYQAIEKLRKVSPAERAVGGKLTYVYHLFPNVMVATFPAGMIFVVALEPLAVDRTRFVTHILTDRPPDDGQLRAGIERSQGFVDLGAVEDRDVAIAIQRGLASGANEFFEFGRFEGAIAHFHRTLDAALGDAA